MSLCWDFSFSGQMSMCVSRLVGLGTPLGSPPQQSERPPKHPPRAQPVEEPSAPVFMLS